MAKKTDINHNDMDLFRRSVGRVRPMANDKVVHDKPKPVPFPHQRQREQTQVLEDMMSDAVDPADLDTGDELVFSRPGLQHTVLRKLRRGQYPVRAELDLHGLFVAEARKVLAAFLQHCQINAFQCVRIIHGKGLSSRGQKPVLKGKVNHWLQQRNEVLAFCSARPLDGGTGAIYVLLKR